MRISSYWKQYLTAIMCALIAGCGTVQNYSLTVNSWQGTNSSLLYDAWGYPHKIETLPNGNKLLTYSNVEKYKSSTTVTKSDDNKTAYVTGGDTNVYRCTTWFEVNSRQIIVNTNFKGNNCFATSDFVKSHGYNVQPKD